MVSRSSQAIRPRTSSGEALSISIPRVFAYGIAPRTVSVSVSSIRG